MLDYTFRDTKMLYNPDFWSPDSKSKSHGTNYSTIKHEIELKKRRLGFNLNLGTTFTGKNDT